MLLLAVMRGVTFRIVPRLVYLTWAADATFAEPGVTSKIGISARHGQSGRLIIGRDSPGRGDDFGVVLGIQEGESGMQPVRIQEGGGRMKAPRCIGADARHLPSLVSSSVVVLVPGAAVDTVRPLGSVAVVVAPGDS